MKKKSRKRSRSRTSPGATKKPSSKPRNNAEIRPAAEDGDLVRVYLKHIGKRPLLKAKDEQEIGLRIEKARGELQAALGGIRAARLHCSISRDKVRSGETPAAELILLPDGGELKKENVEPVLKALASVQRLVAKADASAELKIGRKLRDLPIRPSLVDEDPLRAAPHRRRVCGHCEARPLGPERTAARRALEARAGMPHRAASRPLSRSARTRRNHARGEAPAARIESSPRRVDCQASRQSRACRCST